MEANREIETLIAEGSNYASMEQFDRANKAFARALELGSTDSTAFYGRAFCLRKLGNYAQAQVVLDKALSLYTDDTRLVKEQALLQYDQQRYKEAAESFDRALIVDGYDELVLWGKAVSLRLQKRWGDAEEAIAEALNRLPGNATLLNERGLLRYDQRRYAEAIEDFDQVLATDAGNETALQWKIASLRFQRRFDEADRVAQEALNKLPDSVVILNERAALRYDQRQYKEALEDFDRVLSIDPNNEYAHWGRISSLRLQRRFDEAEEALKEALDKLQASARILNEQALLHYDQRRYAEAIEAFDRVLAIDPGNEDALGWRITSLRMQRRFDEAEGAIREAQDRLPESARIMNERGWLYYGQQQYDQAVAAFDQVLALYPDNEDALRWKATSLRLQRRYEEAGEAIGEALDRLPDNATIINERGWLYLDQDQFDRANECFGRTIELNLNWTQPYFGRIETFRRMGRNYEAREVFQQLRRSFPDDPEVREQLGWYYVGQNDPMNAMREFEWILERDGEDISGITGLGAVYFSQARYEEAADRFREVLNVASDVPIYRTNLAWALVRQAESPRLDEAEEQCREALRLDRKLAPALGCLGIIAYKRGNLRESEDYLRASIEADQREGNYSDLGALYIQMGRYDEAEENLKKAIEINRNDTAAHLELGNLYLQTERVKEAIGEFRQAAAIDPNAEDPPRALAIALMRTGEFGEAERFLRHATRHLDEARRWQLHLTFCRLLTSLGDIADELGNATDARQYYREAMEEVQRAMRLKPYHPDSHFHAGIVQYKLGAYRKAYNNFRSYPEDGENYSEAVRNVNRIKELLRDERRLQRGGIYGGVVIGAVSTVLVGVLWYAYFFTDKVTETMLTLMSPILLGLVVVAFLLPALIRLKLPGLEAELSQPKESVSSGPKGEVGFGGSQPTISSGPR